MQPRAHVCHAFGAVELWAYGCVLRNAHADDHEQASIHDQSTSICSRFAVVII